MADYYINSDKGKELANSLRAGDMAEASDGSTWRKEADGSITVTKNGQTMTGRVGVSAPAVSETASSGSASVSTPVLEESQSQQSSPLQTETQLQTTELEKAQGQQPAQKTEELSASEKAKEATSNVTAGLGQSMSDDLLNQAIQQAMKPETYTIGSAKGVLMTEKMQKAGDMAEAADGSLWKRNEDGSITVTKDGKTYTANVDRAAAKQDPQWAVLTAPPEDTTDYTSGKKSKKKSSGSSSGASSGGGNYYATVPQTATEETTVQQAATTDRATLRKQAATAQKEMGDLARQISVAKIRGKDTSDLQAQYNAAKARYDSATTQINAPQQLTTTAARKEAAAEKNAAAHENASAVYKAESIRNDLSTETAREEKVSQRAEQQIAENARKQEERAEPKKIATTRKELLDLSNQIQVGRARGVDTCALEAQYNGLNVYLEGLEAARAYNKATQSETITQPTDGRVSEQEFSRSPAMVQQYGTYQNYLQAARQNQVATVEPKRDSSLGGKLFTMLSAGLGQFNSSVASFADTAATAVETVESYLTGGFTKDGKYVKGDSAFTKSLLQPIHDWANYTRNTSNALNEQSARNWDQTAAGSVANTIGTGVIAALPQAALALMTLGTSSAGTLTQTSAGLAGSIETAIQRISNDPSFWLSFMQETGGNFAEAKSAGATDEQAILSATIAGLANAAIEVGGGLENNGWMNDSTLSKLSKAKNLITGAVEEGGEELIQNPISRAMQKLVYDGDRQWLSLDNTAEGRDAVFNPFQSAEEFATGAAVGGILGAGNLALSRALNSRSQSQTQNTQLSQDEILDASMQAAMRGEALTEPLQAANQTTQQTTQAAAERGTGDVITGEALPKISMEDFANNESSVWNNGAYEDDQTKNAIMRKAHNDMVKNGEVVTIPESVTNDVAEHFPDMRGVSKAERTPVLKQKLSELKTSLRRYLSGLKGASYEFDVNGNVLDARLYDTGIREVMDRVTQEKSSMLFGSDQIFRNAQYLYSTPDYDSNPNVYRWNYFYTPVQIGDQTVGVRIAVRDMKPTTGTRAESQIYHWGIKKDTALDGGHPGETPKSAGVSSAASFNPTVAQPGNPVNQNVSATDSTGAAPAGFDPLSHASNQYGAIPPGEKASRVVDIPASMDGETKVRRFTRTAAEAQVTTDEMVNRIENLVADGKLDYEVYGNKQALQDGGKLIEKQYTRGKTIEQIRSDFIRDANNGKGGAKFVSQGTMLYADAIAAGDYQTASDILVALAAVETNAGQTVQAARLLKSMSPEGRIFTVQKMVSNLEAQINQRRSANRQIEIDVPDALLNAYQNATTETAQQTALDNIYQNIADQVPTTLREGLQQWRYFSMLANPSTHAKNITGNVSGAVAKIGKDNIGALLETIFIGDKPGYRTKAFLNLASEADQNLLNKAWADYDTASELFEDSVGKYSQSSGEINDRRRYWKINDPKNAVTKEIDKALGTAEKIADFNTKALEVEDIWFSKPMYATALASYMKANHLTEVTDAARTYAMSEAKRGTYNDLNAVSKWASQIGNNSKIGRFLAGAIYPFKKVPANVMVRTVEYSPLGFAKGVYDLIQMGKGNTDYTAAKAIDDFAAGVTGTALLGLGAMLAKHGLLRATGIGDDEEKEQQKNAFGAKDFSLIAGDIFLPIDSFTLTGTGLLTGAQIWEAVQNAKNGDEPVSLEDILDALSKITDPVFEQSMLTGLDSVISTIQKSDNTGNGEMAAKLAIQVIGNYIGQYVPTLLGRIASSTDKNQRSTYIEPDGPWDPIQSAIQGVQKKVPGWRQQMAITYGNWGVPVEGNGAGSTASAIGKAVTPIYPSQKKTDPVEEEIARLHDADSAYANFYKRPSKKISVDGKSVKLTSEQYGNYVVARGQTDYNLRSAMLGNDLYKSLPDQVKSAAMDLSQEYANEIGKQAAGVGYQSDKKWVNELAGASQNEVLNAIFKRAVESTGYISEDTQNQLSKVNQAFAGADYVGLSDEIANFAKEKANEYFSAVEAVKYGGELTETQKELADKYSKELARYFLDEAINDRFKSSDGETKFDKVLDAYEKNDLNDTLALAVLSDDAVQAYDRYGRSAGVTPEMMLMASNAKANIKEETDEDGKVTNSAKDQFDAWLDKQWLPGTMTRWTDDQKDAVRMAFYKDASKTYSYLSDQLHKGNINTSAAKSELSTTYQSGWTHNVKGTGAKMVDYVDAIVEYEDRPSSEELDDAGYSYVWQWFCDYLNTTDLTREQKYAMAISIKKNDYAEGTMKKIWNRLR